ncbi:hypothetical protein V6N13_072203 [Hibiscus sabdariffa]
MWFLLWLAWCWFVTPSRSVDARCGQLRFRCHVLPSSAGVPTPLATLLADFGDADFRCRFPCDALWLFRSHALLVSVRVSILLVALLLTDFGRRLLILSSANLLRPLAEILSCFLLPLWLCFGGPLYPPPLPCSRAWHGAFPRPFWPFPVALSAITSFYGLIRGWRMLDCLRIPLLCIRTDLAWFVVYGCACRPCSVSRSTAAPAPRFALPRRFAWQPNAHEAPWLCLPAPSAAPARSLGPWQLPLPGVRCQGPLCCLSLCYQGTPSWLCVRCPWWFPQPGVCCQGPPCCLRPLCCLGPLCWLVRAPCPGWRPPAHLWPPFVVAWCSSFSSQADLRALHYLPCKLHLCSPSPTRTSRVSVVKDAEVPPLSPAPSVASSPPASASAAAASVPAPAASDAAASVPVSAPVGPAPVASDAAASDVPVTAGRVAAGSAPMSAPPPRGKVTVDDDVYRFG